ncbi:hypothetical protein [Thermococcus stetteri]|uniref:hypothetical protein n=1 Tax=Thermococcus stetteri TaxID=49900 RepID=UPI001AE1B307|nr:hypothetical protein [Thermococcus stetteri]MBP1912651.1 hypothetical protein [Thermococcus stetteri]
MKEKILALFMVMIILTSTGAVVAADNVTSSNDESEVQEDVGNETNGTANATLGLLKVVDRLANYTAQLINTSNVSNETLAIYNKANELREKAWEAYNSGNQTVAVKYAVGAMHLYREVIMAVKHGEIAEEGRGKETPPGMARWKLQNAVRVELEMARNELRYAELIMNRTNVTPEFVLAYNRTKSLVEKVKGDLASGNFTLLKEDFPKLVQARAELHRQIILTTSKTFKVQVVMAVGRQLMVLDELIPRLTNISREVDSNLTKEIEELKVLREELRQAMISGDREKVVEILREIHEKILEIRKMLMKSRRIKELPWRPPITPNPGKGAR